MRVIARLAAATALLGLLMGSALAEPLAFGGRGEDAIYEAAAADGGFFAAGTTASTDGDLDVRTRTGETGWALRVDGDGQRLWSFCSGKSGMAVMTAPHAYADGRFAVVLTDETRQRGEWIVLDSRGRQESRAVIPALFALCPQGKTGKILDMQSAGSSSGPCLLLLLAHEDTGALCCSALYPDGGVRACGEFYGDAGGVLLPLEGGGAAHIGAELGAVAVTRLAPGTPPEAKLIALSEDGVGVSRVTTALADGDGSLLIAMQTVTASQKSAGRLLRVNAEGETLFTREAEGGAPGALTETDTGYAALLGGQVIFFDEDGMLQGQADAPEAALALLPAGEGVYALTHDPERGRRQAVFTRILPRADAAQSRADAPESTPEPKAAKATEAPSGAAQLALGEGHLRCESAVGGVLVTRVDGAGGDIWQTRIPIHTAADRLTFESAQIGTDGELLLHGYYETDLPDGLLRERAQVRLSADGVLREIGLAGEE